MKDFFDQEPVTPHPLGEGSTLFKSDNSYQIGVRSNSYRRTAHANSGKRLPKKLDIIATTTRLSLSDLARKLVTNNANNALIVTSSARRQLLRVMQGKRNTLNYISIIEQNWHLPISELRAYYSEGSKRLTPQERMEFLSYYKTILQTKKQETK